MLSIAQSLIQLFYPHYCIGCGTDHLGLKQQICSRCNHYLPDTHFFAQAGNPVEKVFYGRIRVEQAAACYYFTKNSLIQELMVQLKYRNNREIGHFLGRMMGYALRSSERFSGVDMLIPLPLNPKKEFQRGYNQAAIICEGISEIWPKPLLTKVVIRKKFTDSQTSQNRIARWQNMDGVFEVTEPEKLQGKHVLLVDDVITTGATLEACGQSLLEIPRCKLSIAAAAYTI